MVAESTDAILHVLKKKQTHLADIQKSGFVQLPAPLKTFVGRRELLEGLEKRLASYEKLNFLTPIVLKGPAGVGKTELAYEFANAHVKEFSLICTIQSALSCRQSYELLAEMLGIPCNQMSLEDLQEKVNFALSNHASDKPWLLIFDDLENPVPLPSRGGMVIATSPNDLWLYQSDVLDVNPFTAEEALELFPKELLGDVQSCLDLIASLDGYPILLSKAIRYIQATHVSDARTYMESLQEIHPLWEESTETDRYTKVLGRTLLLSLSKLEEENPMAHEFLQLCAYFSADQIDDTLMNLWVKQQGKSKRAAGEMIQSIEKFSLGRYANGKLLIHRFLQPILRNSQKDPTSSYLKALALLEEGVEYAYRDELSSWENCESLFVSSLALIHHKKAWAAIAPKGGKLCVQLSNWLRKVSGDHEKAIHYAKMGSERLKEEHGLSSRETAAGLTAWALCYSEVGENEKALRLHKMVLKILAKASGAKDPSLATCFDNAACCSHALGQYEEAAELFQSALAIWEETLQADDSELARGYQNLGRCLYHLEQYQKAYEMYKAAFKIRKKIYGENHLKLAASLIGMGGCLVALGKYEKALEFFQAALEIQKEKLGNEHLDVAKSLFSMTGCLEALGKYEKALDLYAEACDTQEAALGADHLDRASSLDRMGRCYWKLAKQEDDQGSQDAALVKFKTALKIRERALGADHLDVAKSLNNIGTCLSELNRHDEALDMHKAALEIQKEKLGDEHLEVAKSLSMIGDCLGSLQKFDVALTKYIDALAIQEKILGENHLDLVTTLSNIGDVLAVLDKEEDALVTHMRAFNIRKAVLGEDHLDVASSLDDISGCLTALGREEQAKAMSHGAREIRKKAKPS